MNCQDCIAECKARSNFDPREPMYVPARAHNRYHGSYAPAECTYCPERDTEPLPAVLRRAEMTPKEYRNTINQVRAELAHLRTKVAGLEAKKISDSSGF